MVARAGTKASAARSAPSVAGTHEPARAVAVRAKLGRAAAGKAVGRGDARRDRSRDPAPATITDPATGRSRYIADINRLRRNCAKLVTTSDGYWQAWAARQLYAMGMAPKLLIAAKYKVSDLVSETWLNPDCEIELRVNELQPPNAADRAFVYPDGERVEDIRDACQAAWLAHDLVTIVTIVQRYGLYWSALLPIEKVRRP